MTRINLVDPTVLTDKHLMAEYRELPRIFTAVLKLQEQHCYNFETIGIPSEYVLGKGHVKFFYNKIGWLLKRYESIFNELVFHRGFNLDKDMFVSIKKEAMSLRRIFFTEYTPTPQEIYLNMARLCKRSGIDSVLKELSEE